MLLVYWMMPLRAETIVPEVQVKRHALVDVYVFTRAHWGTPPYYINAICTEDEDLRPAGAKVGASVGFHMPDGVWRYQLGVGYHYQNFTYKGRYDQKGISAHYLNLDVRFMWSIVQFGLETDVLLSPPDVPKLQRPYWGYNEHIFTPATLAPYVGLAMPIVPNLFFEGRMGVVVLTPFDKQQIKYYLLDKPILLGCQFEFGFSYRIFTSGKRQRTW